MQLYLLYGPISLLLLLAHPIFAAYSTPIGIQPDPTYQTGIASIITSSLTSSSTYTITFNFMMATSSLNASLGIYSIDYNQRNRKHGFKMLITSVTSSTMEVYVEVVSNHEPINILRVSYLVSYSPFLDINYAQLTFSGSNVLFDSSSPDEGCYLACRSYVTSIVYATKSSPKGVVALSGFTANGIGGSSTSNGTEPYIGIFLGANWNTAHLSLNITLYGLIQTSFISLFYVVFQPNTIYSLNSRNIMWGRSSVGCTYHTNGCGVGGSISDIQYGTGNCFVNVDSPYNEQMVFYALDRFIVKWTNSDTDKVAFSSGPITRSGTNLRVALDWTGNVDGYFNLAFSFFTIQTFHCPNTPPFLYYPYSNYRCTDDCGIGYYPNATRYCQPCSTLCYTCTAVNTCTGCHNSQNRVLSGSTCVCDTAGGFYDDGSSTICPACNYTCKTCTGASGGTCLSCESSYNRTLNVNTCPCISGYFNNGSASCVACHYTCGSTTCNGTNINRCQSCNSIKQRIILTNMTCGCTTGYYDDGTSNQTCKKCHYSCLTCWATNSYCTTCLFTNMRTLNNSDNTCPCNTGYYDNGAAMCQLCDGTCQSCDGPLYTNCLSCTAVSTRVLNGTICQCPGGQYDSAGTCVSCHYSCQTCSAGTSLNCTSCSSANFRTQTNTSCTCIDSYVDTTLAMCSACSPSCLTCAVTTTNCTSCHNGTARFIAGSSCLCAGGYVDVLNNGSCTICHYTCDSCSGSTTNCDTCPANRVMVTGSCLCPTGTYDDGSSATCQNCPSSCLNCSSILDTTCTACNSLYLRTLSPSPLGSCICSGAYYDSGALLCSSCDSKCFTCTGTATNCTSCDTATNHRQLTASYTCDCMTSYFNSGSLVICQSCALTCLNCSILPTNCTACNVASRYLSGNTCLCNNGTYQDGMGVCQPCSYTCLTCSGTLTTCLTCQSGVNRTKLGSSCPCDNGYYDNGGVACQKCLYSCLICTTGSTCVDCPVSSHRTMQANGSCTCDDGYYDDGSSASCLACDPTCLTCQFYSQCLSCNATQLRTWDNILLLCNCPSNYHDPGSGSCILCHYSCLTCSSPSNTSCLTCPSSRQITASYTCPCKTSYYQYNLTCVPCSINCLQCSQSMSNCTDCRTGSYLSSYQCLCSSGYYQNGLTCSPCDTVCSTCVGSSSSCTGCNTTYGTVLQGASCVCPDGKYQDNSTLVCMNCSTSCQTCTGQASNQCSSCASGVYRTYDAATTSCPCDPGYYSTGALLCQPCIFPCDTCNGGSTLNCTSCISGYNLIASSCILIVSCPSTYYYDGGCVSKCPNTTYPSTGVCLQCGSNCLTCISNTLCSSCQTGFTLLADGTCQGSCPSSYYSLNQKCLICPTGCLTCTYRASLSQVVCNTCLPGYLVNSYSCTSSCPSLTHIIVQNRCVPCLSPCLTCTNLTSTGCITCISGYIFFNNRCLSSCPQGYYLENGSCLTCLSNCLICQKSNCQKCTDGYYIGTDGYCIENGYYSSQGQKKSCHANCLTCTDGSFSSCIACSNYRGDYARMAVSGYCDCWQGSVDLGDGTCDSLLYNSLQKATQTLLASTKSITYGSSLLGMLSFNMLTPLLSFYYQQQYGNLYYLNVSAVGQTDLILEQYAQYSPNTFLRGVNIEREQSKSRRLYFINVQEVQSLFMRGQKWEYLSIWALPIVVVLGIVWVIAIVMNCIVKRFKVDPKKQQDFFKRFLISVTTFIRESIIILIHLMTTNQIFLYAFASFKIIASDQYTLNNIQLTLSVILLIYYVIYLIRLMVVCYKYKEQDKKRFRLLWGCFIRNKKKGFMSRLYLPLVMVRSIFITLFMVTLSTMPIYQIGSVLGIFSIWFIYSICCCPYPFYIRVFIRIYQLLFIIQLTILTLSVLQPEYSRMTPAIALIVVNYLQIVNIAVLAVCIFLASFYNFRCLNREQNVVTNLDSNNNGIIARDQQTIENINEEYQTVINTRIQRARRDSGETKVNGLSMSQYQHLMDSLVAVSPESDNSGSHVTIKQKRSNKEEEPTFVQLKRNQYRTRMPYRSRFASDETEVIERKK